MRLSTVILPIERWSRSREKWRRAEELGFDVAYTYDHLSWQRLKDRAWFGAVPTLAAAATVTSRIRLGTLVTSPNFRHPVPLAKELLSLDDLSEGRLTIGVGSGGLGSDATVLGAAPWSTGERTARFIEFIELLDELLRNSETSSDGMYYSAREALMVPGTIQRPRPPIYIAADGKRGTRLVAQYGEGWVTLGRSSNDRPCFDVVSSQLSQLNETVNKVQLKPKEFERVLLDGFSDERPLQSLGAFVDWAGKYQELGMTELVIHWPEPNSPFDTDMSIFEAIATDGRTQLAHELS